MNYQSWLKTVPTFFTDDSLWKMKAYRVSLFLADIGWHDVSKLDRDGRTRRIANQLYRSLGSVGANLAEGYSRNTGKDRARFYAYSLGSARESRDRYYKGRHVLGEQVVNHRLPFVTETIQLLLVMIPQQRHFDKALREQNALYHVDTSSIAEESISTPTLDQLLNDVPLPD